MTHDEMVSATLPVRRPVPGDDLCGRVGVHVGVGGRAGDLADDEVDAPHVGPVTVRVLTLERSDGDLDLDVPAAANDQRLADRGDAVSAAGLEIQAGDEVAGGGEAPTVAQCLQDVLVVLSGADEWRG